MRFWSALPRQRSERRTCRQVALDLHAELRVGEEVGLQQPKESMPVAQIFALDSQRTPLPQSARWYSLVRACVRRERQRRNVCDVPFHP
jgi:hypothetical protein